MLSLIRPYLRFASLVVVAVVLGVALLVVPERLWTPVSIAACGLFCLLIALATYSPVLLPSGRNGGDAAGVASIGIHFAIFSGLLVMSGAGLLVALLGWDTLAMVLMVLTTGAALLGFALAKISGRIVDAVASRTAGPSDRSEWVALLRSLRSVNLDPELSRDVDALIEKIQFASSDTRRYPDGINVDIGEKIDAFSELVLSGVWQQLDLKRSLVNINYLLDKRDATLRAERSKI